MITARREFAELKAENQFLLVDERAAREAIRSLDQLKIETPRELFRQQASALEAAISRSSFQIVKVQAPRARTKLEVADPASSRELTLAKRARGPNVRAANESTLKNPSLKPGIRGSACRREELFAEKYMLP